MSPLVRTVLVVTGLAAAIAVLLVVFRPGTCPSRVARAGQCRVDDLAAGPSAARETACKKATGGEKTAASKPIPKEGDRQKR